MARKGNSEKKPWGTSQQNVNQPPKEHVVAKKRNYQKMAASSSNPTPPQENNQQNPEELCSANELSSEHVQGPSKKKGRGAAVGDQGHGMEAEIYQNRIITTKAVRSIGPLFKSELKGPFITWSEYPANHLDLLYKRWINFNFKFSCPEEEVRAAFNLHVKRRYNDWMSEIRNSVFKIHHTAAARYTNHPSFLNPEIWIIMVDKWLKDEWQKESKKNAINRGKSTIVHTTGSVPMAKYMKEEVDRIGVEPSPIEMFKKFHISKTKEGNEEHWPNESTKYFYEIMVDQKAGDQILGDKGEDLSDWDIYKEVIGNPKRGLGASMKAPGDDYPSTSQNCNKSRCLDRDNEFKQLKDEVAELKQTMQLLLQKHSSPTGDTAATNSDEVSKNLSARED